ncbi:MAG: ubiquinone biosynthesis protein, partial [Polyangiales bacterium]
MQTQTQSHHTPPSPHRTGADELRAWLMVIDAALRVVEQTIWESRRLATEWADAARKDILHIRDRTGELASLQARLKRATQCGWVLTKIASSYRWHLTRAAFTTRKSAAAALTRLHTKNADRFRDLCMAQGGAFLKVGQLLSARPDLLPMAWVDSLSCLQDDASPVPIEEILKVLEEELGGTVEELFLDFEREPLAAASIGQVHRASLLDGRRVAVKVQRPGVAETIEIDMELLCMFLEGTKSMLPPTDYDTIVGEVKKLIREELDYQREREHTARAASFFADDPRISAPMPVV